MSADTVTIAVRHRGGDNFARAGRGKASKSASSTNAGIYAAQAAAEKYFGEGISFVIECRQEGSCCSGTPSLYVARAKGGAP